jgi:hypothetical protein
VQPWASFHNIYVLAREMLMTTRSKKIERPVVGALIVAAALCALLAKATVKLGARPLKSAPKTLKFVQIH